MRSFNLNGFPIFIILSISFIVSINGAPCPLEFPGISCDPNDVKFYLYSNPSNSLQFEELIYLNSDSITASNFDSNKNVILLTHGFTQTFLSDSTVTFKNAFLSNGFTDTANIIAVDWGHLSAAYAANFTLQVLNTISELPQYIAAVGNVPIVGERMAEFLIFLMGNGYTNANKIHLIGQSLGAHASGSAATAFTRNTSTLLARVTGTEPAGPLYTFPLPSLITKNVATFVDIVHTNRGGFGNLENLGQVDFDVNGGFVQPSCPILSTDLFCAHNTAPHYYAQSIGNRTLLATNKALCPSCLNQAQKVIFGEFCPPGTKGVYGISLNI